MSVAALASCATKPNAVRVKPAVPAALTKPRLEIFGELKVDLEDVGSGGFNFDNITPTTLYENEATADIFIPTTGGEYAVIVTDTNGCKGISDYFNFIIESVENINTSLIVYPNPSGGIFTLESNLHIEDNIVIYSSTGKSIITINPSEISDGKIIVDLSNQPKGIYIIQLINNQSVINHRLVLQ